MPRQPARSPPGRVGAHDRGGAPVGFRRRSPVDSGDDRISRRDRRPYRRVAGAGVLGLDPAAPARSSPRSRRSRAGSARPTAGPRHRPRTSHHHGRGRSDQRADSGGAVRPRPQRSHDVGARARGARSSDVGGGQPTAPHRSLPIVSLDDLPHARAARRHRRPHRDGADGGDRARLRRCAAQVRTSIATSSGLASPTLIAGLTRRLSGQREPAAHRHRRRDRGRFAACRPCLRRARACRGPVRRRPASRTCRMRRSGGVLLVHRATHRTGSHNGRRVETEPGGVPADPRDRDRHAGLPIEAGRRRRHHPVASARRLDHDPGAGDRIQTHPGDVDLVARRGRRRRSRRPASGSSPSRRRYLSSTPTSFAAPSEFRRGEDRRD